MKHLPNALTLLRLVLAPVIAWLMWSAFTPAETTSMFPDLQARILEIANTMTLAAILFVVAALTDLFDGMIARAFDAHSKFGRIIDPIADKALVGLPLLVIGIVTWSNPSFDMELIIAAAIAVIILRDIVMTIVRLRAPDGEGVRVSSLAKWKTALELAVVGAYLIALPVMFHLVASGQAEQWERFFPMLGYGWIALLVLAAALSAWTGFQYLRPAKTPA
jgi:CDP-diacylglycerol--glycerol-3-phosphate 3-phosphatidyltransferase